MLLLLHETLFIRKDDRFRMDIFPRFQLPGVLSFVIGIKFSLFTLH